MALPTPRFQTSSFQNHETSFCCLKPSLWHSWETDAGTPCSPHHSLHRCGAQTGPCTDQGHCWVVTSSPDFGHSSQPHGAHDRVRTRRGRGWPQLELLLFQEPRKPRNGKTPHLYPRLVPSPSHQLFGAATMCLLISVGETPQPGHSISPVSTGPRLAL